MSIDQSDRGRWECEYCGESLDEHDRAGRCPTSGAFGEPVTYDGGHQ